MQNSAKKLLVLIFCLLSSFSILAQIPQIDSIVSILKSNPNDSIFNKAALSLLGFSSIHNVEDYKPGLIKTFTEMERKGLQNKNYKDCARASRVLANFYESQLIQDSAIYYFLKSVRNYEKSGDFNELASVYYRVARIYYYKANHKEALRYVNLILAYVEQNSENKQVSMVTTYMLKGILLQNIPDSIKKARKYYLKAIEFGEKNPTPMLGVLYNNYGEYLDMCDANYPEALKYFNKAKSFNPANPDSGTIAYAGFCTAKIYWKLKKYNEALSELQWPTQYWTRIGSVSDLLNAYESLFWVYEDKGDYKNTVIYLKKHMRLKDSVSKLTNSQNMAELETKFQVEKKDKQLLQLKEKAAIEQLEKEKQENKSQMLMIGIGVSLMLGGFALYAYFNKQKANKLLDNEKKLVEQQKEILEIKNKEILDSINYAKRIQNAILPAENLFSEIFKEHFIFYKPKDIVAGDFYWLYQKNGLIYLAVCDCTGHGVPGALVSVVCNNSLERAVNEFNLSKPSDILNKTRKLVKEAFSGNEENMNDGMDMSLICFPAKRGADAFTIQFAAANNPVWYCSGGQMNEIQADKQPIGNYTNEKPFNNTEITVSDGIFYLFTDGYADQFGGPKGKKFKYKQLNELLISLHTKPLNEQHTELRSTFENWKGNLEQVDDVCMIGIKL